MKSDCYKPLTVVGQVRAVERKSGPRGRDKMRAPLVPKFDSNINDLPNSVPCIPRLFADDTCLLLADANLNSLHENINNELINLSHWCKANKLSVNPVKSNAMIISLKQCNAYPTPTTSLLYDEVPVKSVNEFKYLGVVLDSNFDFHAHIQLIENKISRAVEIISKLKYIFPSDALLKLYI